MIPRTVKLQTVAPGIHDQSVAAKPNPRRCSHRIRRVVEEHVHKVPLDIQALLCAETQSSGSMWRRTRRETWEGEEIGRREPGRGRGGGGGERKVRGREDPTEKENSNKIAKTQTSAHLVSCL
eukprot:768677-Hanusia_phi.AAC.10